MTGASRIALLWWGAAGLFACASTHPAAARAPALAPASTPVTAARPAACPAAAPVEGTRCEPQRSACVYGDTPECTTSYECYQHHWFIAARGSCGAHAEQPCPESLEAAERLLDGPPLTCVYPNGVVCRARYPDSSARCSGVPVRVERPMRPSWACTAEHVNCERAAESGAPCEVDGESCGPQCCGVGYTCTRHAWVSTMYPCPP